MSIHILLGKPGSGKSLYGTTRLILELVEGTRNIVTNLPLRPDRLNEYIQKRYPLVNARMVDRLRMLKDDQLRDFYKYRGPEDGPYSDAVKVDPVGVAYFLDEAHIGFNARDWASIGRGVLHYLSQHRKLGDIVWVITQAPGNLDKQFRSVAEDFTVLRNEYTAKYGIFRGRGRFVRKTYLAEPQGNSEPFETASFHLDKEGIASCYDTAKGIGVHGNKADIGRRAKGIPIWVVIPGALFLGLLCVFLPWLMGRGVAKVMVKDGPKTVVARRTVEKLTPVVADLPSQPQPAIAAPVPKPAALPGIIEDVSPQRTLWAVGYVRRGPSINVRLSDGRVYTERDPELQKVERNSVTISGQKIFFAGPSSGGGKPAGGSGGGSAAPSEGVQRNGGSPEPAKTDIAAGKSEPEAAKNPPISSGVSGLLNGRPL